MTDGRFRIVMGALAALLLAALVGPVVVGNRNFNFRDGGHFYYPLLFHIQEQWNEGRIPLWTPLENGGMPLAANPTSAVFYPLKAIFFVLPYGDAFRWYHILHLAIAWLTCRSLARGLGVSHAGAALAGVSYAFGGYVLFQLHNVIFLVGAAWLPLGMLAAHRIANGGGWSAATQLGLAIALQTLGGDPQTAYMTAMAAGPYVLVMSLGWRAALRWIALAMGAGVFLVAQRALGSEELAREAIGQWAPLMPAGDWRAWVIRISQRPGEIPTWWLILGRFLMTLPALWVVTRFLRSKASASARWPLLKLAAAGLLGGALSAIQILPTREFVAHTDRAAPKAPREPSAFSFAPPRLIELVAPTFFGRQLPIMTRWFPLARSEGQIWVPDVYMGLAAAVFGVSAFTWRRGRPEVIWLTWVLLLSLWLAAGKFGGYAWIGELGKPPVDRITSSPGTYLYGPADGLYWIAELTLPGLQSFRYPSKFLVLTSLCLAVLAGFGLDRAIRAAGRLPWVTGLLAGLGLLLASTAHLASEPVRASLKRLALGSSSFGGFDDAAAAAGLVGTGMHLALTGAALTALLLLARRRPMTASLILGLGVPGLTVLDLGIRQQWLIIADPQAGLDAKSPLLEKIEEHHRRHGDGEPYRIHRTKIWEPISFIMRNSPNRLKEMADWERRTLQPKYGLLHGVNYTAVTGTMSLYDNEFFFGPWTVPTPEAIRASLSGPAPKRIVYHPKVSYNLWNTRYFILPDHLVLDDEDRGSTTLRLDRDGQAAGATLHRSELKEDDVIILENRESFPRAWVVHELDVRPALVGLDRDIRRPVMEEILFRPLDGGQPFWIDDTKREYPHASRAMLEVAGDSDSLRGFSPGGPPAPSEKVRYLELSADRVVLEADVDRPGAMVISETWYPGWRATVNGQPAPVLKAFRAMRAVPVPAGKVRVEMTYRSRPFELGALVSLPAWLGLTAFGVTAFLRRTQPASPASTPPGGPSGVPSGV